MTENALKELRLDEVRRKIAEAVDDSRPPLTTREVGKCLDALHRKTVTLHR
jgi:hypothetical protein